MSSYNIKHSEIEFSCLSSPESLILKEDEVHVWRASLEIDEYQIQNCQKLLSSDELSKAERFLFLNNRNQFLARRGLLRIILAKYIDMEPSELRFCLGPYGKPSLDNSFHRTKLYFNLSQSHGLALYAVTRNKQIGVDIEYINDDIQCRDIVERFFSHNEKDWWRSFPEKSSQRAFFTCWTRKEALLKGMGVGLLIDPRGIDTAQNLGELTRVFNPDLGPGGSQKWSVVDLNPGCDYVAALAAEGEGLKPKFFEIPRP